MKGLHLIASGSDSEVRKAKFIHSGVFLTKNNNILLHNRKLPLILGKCHTYIKSRLWPISVMNPCPRVMKFSDLSE